MYLWPGAHEAKHKKSEEEEEEGVSDNKMFWVNQFDHLFAKTDDKLPASLDEILDDKSRKRGRKWNLIL